MPGMDAKASTFVVSDADHAMASSQKKEYSYKGAIRTFIDDL